MGGISYLFSFFIYSRVVALPHNNKKINIEVNLKLEKERKLSVGKCLEKASESGYLPDKKFMHEYRMND